MLVDSVVRWLHGVQWLLTLAPSHIHAGPWAVPPSPDTRMKVAAPPIHKLSEYNGLCLSHTSSSHDQLLNLRFESADAPSKKFNWCPVASTILHGQPSRQGPDTLLLVHQGVMMYAPCWEGLAERIGNRIA